jgi:hypothetical protein
VKRRGAVRQMQTRAQLLLLGEGAGVAAEDSVSSGGSLACDRDYWGQRGHRQASTSFLHTTLAPEAIAQVQCAKHTGKLYSMPTHRSWRPLATLLERGADLSPEAANFCFL